MKPAWPFKQLIFAFAVALLIYVIFYTGIEHRRTRNGPWQVAFTNEANIPTLIISEPRLHISNLKINFPSEHPFPAGSVLIFEEPRPVPLICPPDNASSWIPPSSPAPLFSTYSIMRSSFCPAF